ncbi:PHP domain-containing protein [Shewanella sp. NIFS-20-20]|uniref:RNase RNM n=1 Tax=Shewanella sp. NIFS-20-20 TaxID=2853806 RepID=UPI001C457A09|nr:PHP domain-containing protein [Shewanella sp. NIFS-20-20]MBV7315044.1 PHP domain-containing protein [Shewanella sp. NIFS-20-20]
MNENTVMTQVIDLHSHTTASDGRLTPEQLVQRAADKGVHMLAITDHDSVAAMASAHVANQALAAPLNLINGAEISTRWHSYDIHVVALNIDITHPQLLDFLDNQTRLRDQRAQEIGIRLAKAGIEGTYEAAQHYANGAVISRGHFARVLIDKGYAADNAGVFKKYLAKGKTGYVPNNWGDMASAIEIIHQAGGLAVLAHPSAYQLSAKWLRRLVTEFKAAGGDAMEVVLGQQNLDDRANLVALSRQHELLTSVGSDFHFVGGWVELGRNLFLPAGLNWVWQSPLWKDRS